MTPEQTRERLRLALEQIAVPEVSWDAAARRITARRRRRRGRAAASVTAGLAVITLAVGLGVARVGTDPGQAARRHHASELARQRAAEQRRRAIARRERAAQQRAELRRQAIAGLAASPGFLVYLAGRNLSGPMASADAIKAGSSAPASRHPVTILASSPGDALWAPAVNARHTKIVYVEGSQSQIGSFNGEGNLMLASIDGSDARQVTSSGSDTDPAWTASSSYTARMPPGRCTWPTSAGPVRIRSPPATGSGAAARTTGRSGRRTGRRSPSTWIPATRVRSRWCQPAAAGSQSSPRNRTTTPRRAGEQDGPGQERYGVVTTFVWAKQVPLRV